MVGSLETRKRLGQVFTPEDIAQTLVAWVVGRENDRLLDPSCGDGRFLACHRASVGVEVDRDGATIAHSRAPWALIHEGDFFAWASETRERFEAAVGNPPFIRYQHFTGKIRDRALQQAARLGAKFNGLASSWAPFLVVTAGLLKPGGKMAFVVPAEIGHAPYAIPVLNTLCEHFDQVRVIAIREKLFPDFSEDAWLLFARGFGGHTDSIELSIAERFVPSKLPAQYAKRVQLSAWREAGCRLRKFLLPENSLAAYQELISHPSVVRFTDVASAGIGYVSGANDFFHLRPSEARAHRFPDAVLRVTIRKSEQLPSVRVDAKTVSEWLRRDEPVLLLDLSSVNELTPNLKSYLDSSKGHEVRKGYKCRNRNPWYVVPDIRVPDAFLSYMSGTRPALVRNDAGCVCTNSVHAVFRKPGHSIHSLQKAWLHPLVDLSCELEGHPLGGGMLKLEPREAANVRLPLGVLPLDPFEKALRPPLVADLRNGNWYLSFDASTETEKEHVVLGGLKSKRIDLVASKDDVGPVLAISVKGTSRAFRNLVNRTEEAIGDCANIHSMYPGVVYGFVHFLKATDPNDRTLKPNDISLDASGDVLPAIKAYSKILEGLTGRRLVRNDLARYEAVGLALVKVTTTKQESPLLTNFPPPGSPLDLNAFFTTLYHTYDLRFPDAYTDPSLKHLVRTEWHSQSPALLALQRWEASGNLLGYKVRTPQH